MQTATPPRQDAEPTGHVDSFSRDHLPPRDQWPDLLLDGLPELAYSPRLNCAVELLDRMVERGLGSRPVFHFPGGTWTYRELLEQSNRIARVLTEELGLVSGNRVLLRGPNNPMMAACWFGVLKAGGVAVGTMPLFRAKELTDIVTKAEISHALCDARLAGELASALPACPTLRRIAYFGGEAPDRIEQRMTGKPATFADVPTA